MQFSFAQEKAVTGVVSDELGPIVGANVVVKGTTRGTTTDFDGKYTISAKQNDVLEVSYTGKKMVSITVGTANSYNVSMKDDVVEGKDVVVLGYGNLKKEKVISSVKTVSSESMENLTVLSPQQMLQGQAAGVQVVQSSGILGGATVVKIRGNASINAGGRPLYVIDGVPMNDLSFTSGQGGQSLNPLLEINPNDIETQTVLKDAAATAIYGSRGSNGVVLITTKKGRKNKAAVVTIDQNFSITESTDLLSMMNADQFRSFLSARGDNPATFQTGNDFDWLNGVDRTGYSRNTYAGVSGGTDNTVYSLSFGNSEQQGFIIGNELSSNTGRVSVESEVNDRIRVGANLGLSEVKNDRVGSENSTFAPFTSAYLQAPWISPYDANGNFVNTGFIANVVAIEALDINDAKTSRTFGNIFADYKILNGLTYRVDFGVDRLNLEQKERSFEVNSPGGYGYVQNTSQNKYVVTNTLNYDKTFGKHSFNAVLGSTYEQNEIFNVGVEAVDFASDLLLNITSGATNTFYTSSSQNSRLNGYFSRINYAFDNRYNFEVSVRRDGSSRFAPGVKYGNFWALSGGWNVINEKFMEKVSLFSDLRLRASIGTTGNDRVGDFAFFALYSGGAGGAYNNSPGNVYSQPANNEYGWEQSKTTNLGIDLGVLDNRVRLSVDAYVKKTTDMILSPPIPGTNGFTSITGNLGSMENRGFEFDLTTINLRSQDFEWKTSLNIGFNENEVLSLPGAAVDLDGNRFVSGGSSQRAIEGYSVNTFFLIRYAGVNPQTGDAEWLDRNGNITTAPTANDRVIVGDANPDFTGGITNSFRYKNFDLNIFANFSYGNDIFVDGLRFTDNINGLFNKSTNLLDYWTTPGQNSYAPSLTSTTRNTFNQRSTAQLRDGSFLRINNVTLGYNLPKDLIGKSKLFDSARIYFTATNLYTFKGSDLDGIDPETTSTVGNLGQGETFFTPPQSKSYLLGVKLTL
jgi:TonB-linked SusC/RagA family outer membrane protein